MGSWFPKLYDLAMTPLEKTRFKRVRTELVWSASGHVLEIGSGTGVNFPYYSNAERVTAIEPNPLMNKRAFKRIKDTSVPVEVHETTAESLPFADNTFDTVIATLVFCTIPDPVKALAEIRRVSKPGAEILFFEHVQMKQPVLRKAQDFLNPLWKRVCDGCNLNRNTLLLIQQSGIEVKSIESFYATLFLSIHSVNTKL
ncbi:MULTISPECIES: class I SAM-dependent methyltransferase [unclassified Sporosarcina]|uniref:class I SAM-dependent methyltransferase n=1 Tax=unclassified Sporosarcina TaxID=2647733 RepID=UPI00203E22CB|nr:MULTISPECIES: class I SAM-dependent methyltransferase [unclassified Sporosarcina]GKV64718.1 methyltransferase [Sporosarcina sp. NCCP-2331]GLB54828.1 methyltransferase [Sporosarcina sp. NCCP-2378]